MRALRRLVAAAAAALLATPAAADGLTYVAHPATIRSAHPPLIVLMHGAGADERDMIGLWQDLPQTFVVVAPRAPFPDGGGYRWYRNASRTADIALSRKIIGLIVDSAVQRFQADPSRVFIGGFSQGAVMTYAAALPEPSRYRGAAVLSGTLFPDALAHLPPRAELTRESFFVAHGTADRRIPFAAATSARATLERLGVPTAFHAYPGLGHGTDAAETGDLAAWLSERAGEPR